MIDSFLLLLQIFAILIIMIPLNGMIMNLWLKVAQSINLSRKMIVLTSIGFILCLPELFITISAVMQGIPELALGNALGTAIVLISLVAGVIAIYKKELKTNEIFTSDNINLLSFTALLNVILAFDGILSRLDGVILLIGYFLYLLVLSGLKGDFTIIKKNKFNNKKTLMAVLVIIGGIVGIWALSFVLNLKAIDIFNSSGFPLFAIGAVLIAPLGAIPELIFEMELTNKEKSNLTLSELFTSLISNTTLILGILLILSPITITGSVFYYFTTLVLALILILFNYYSRTKSELNWKEGTILLISYILYLVSSLILVLS